MKFCQYCGAQIPDDAIHCPACGCAVNNQGTMNNQNAVDESVNGGLIVLAILIPLFGFIYWPVKAKSRPNCARACGIAAIISWAVSFTISMVTTSMGMGLF